MSWDALLPLEQVRDLQTLNYRRVLIDDIAISDLEQIGIGAFAPLRGFMDQQDWSTVCCDMRTHEGHIWPIPVTLPISPDVADELALDDIVVLEDLHGDLCAVMRITSIFEPDRAWEARHIYATDNPNHPGVRRLLERGRIYIGGPVQVAFLPRRLILSGTSMIQTPSEARREFARRGWKTIVGFQTRNPVHRAHEYIQKAAMEIVDGLFFQPLIGPTKADDIPANVRLKAYEALLQRYYPMERVVVGRYSAAMRYAGPREALMHALVRKNFGCTHFIVGRDHAGVGSFYGPYESHAIFDQFLPQELGIVPLRFDATFYCGVCEGMASAKTCPHPESVRVDLSGSELRRRLAMKDTVPKEFSRPEVLEVLRRYFEERG